MPYDGSGNFNRVMDWTNDAAANIKIKADRHDSEDDNFAAGLSNVITKDGQTQPTANIPLNGKKLVNVGTPTAATDGSTKAYADLKAPIASPVFTGKVTLPTGVAGSAPLSFPVAATPTTPADSDMWPGANTAAGGALRHRIAGVTYSYARLELEQNFAGLTVGGATIPAGAVTSLAIASSIMVGGGGGVNFNAHYDGAWKAAATGFGVSLVTTLATGVINLFRSAASAAAGGTLAFSPLLTFDAAGNAAFSGAVQSLSGSNNFLGNTGGGVTLSPGVAGTVFLRPTPGSATGQFTVGAAGDAVSAGNVSAYSDPRLKDDVEPITDALEIIGALDGVRFTWNNRSKAVGRPGKRDIGVLADQVEKVLPEIVSWSTPHEDEDGERWQTVAYDKLVPVLIEAVKALAHRVEQMEERT